MKSNIVARIVVVVALTLRCATVALAQGEGSCSPAGVSGTWGHTFTGTLFLPAPIGAVPIVAVGTATTDAEGNFTGTQHANHAGSVGLETIRGTMTVNADCSGTLTVGVYDQSGTTLLRTVTWALVFVDNAGELRAAVMSVVINGATVPAVVTLYAKRLFPDHGNR
jgi:hypothetical protein